MTARDLHNPDLAVRLEELAAKTDFQTHEIYGTFALFVTNLPVLIAALRAEAKLRDALEDVVNPLGKIQRDADAQGARLSGMAYQISTDLNFVQGIARSALALPTAPEGEG